MPRKKQTPTEPAPSGTSAVAVGDASPTAPIAGLPKQETVAPGQPKPDAAQPQAGEPDQKQWANPYKSIFTSVAKGFEMGEDRRFNQRVFKFTQKPEQSIIDALKEHGFTYRPKEKAWTISATPATRQLTEQLAHEFAAGAQAMTR
jgi:hypothetical protein